MKVSSRTAGFGGAAETWPALFSCLNAEYGGRVITPARIATLEAGIGDAVHSARCSQKDLVEIHRSGRIGEGCIKAEIHTLAIAGVKHRRGEFRPSRSHVDPHRGETLCPSGIAPYLQLEGSAALHPDAGRVVRVRSHGDSLI